MVHSQAPFRDTVGSLHLNTVTSVTGLKEKSVDPNPLGRGHIHGTWHHYFLMAADNPLSADWRNLLEPMADAFVKDMESGHCARL
jgi:hypothetical protein